MWRGILKFKKASLALQAARALIRSEKRWTQGELAVRARRYYNAFIHDQPTVRCSTKAKNATAFCALGAVKRINGPAERRATAFLRQAGLKIVKNAVGEGSDQDIFAVNDDMGHEATLKMFTLAIRQAKKAGD